ncbi:sugar ABC transporter ATP-binding protein [Christensenella intestinihominis]|uniref:sugar ABC transporter ATP-binding protein n=1 Tax=Christensenella intestinihominis TaxID=1851429 RepID=UPI00082F7BE1|nr:sugar ABC transporter ATP-binding protein [Christensenella intestinihominis]
MSIELKNVTVTFPGVTALDNVSIGFEPGEVHAVLGANGSGKSTLVKVLTGIYQPDAGKGADILVDGKHFGKFDTPMMSREEGITVVHQESPLIDVLSVAESVALFKGYPKKTGGRIDWKALFRYTEELFEFYKIGLTPRMRVAELSAAERGMVSMAIALGKGDDLKKVKALILDEADASIPEADAEKFLGYVRKVADMGIPVIMVTHRLKEVRSICDKVTILNGGELIYTGAMQETDDDFIISKMLRSDQSPVDEACAKQDGEALQRLWELCGRDAEDDYAGASLSVKGLCAQNLNGISFEVGRGEIVGFVGIQGSGVNELPMVLGGGLSRSGGEIAVKGRSLPRKMTPQRAIRAGIMLQPTDRFRQGGVMSESLRDNMLLPNEKRFWHKGKLARQVMQEAILEFDVRPRIIDMPFEKFSGGNQQKAIIGKWLQLHPDVFVMDDPTYGVDPAARKKIFADIRNASAMGVSIVIFSTEPEQLASLCTRVVVLRQGEIVHEMKQEDGTLTRQAIARWCYA